ncbi:MAG: hypothetical protein JWO83_2971 [Caulobacteraceae bacterium]|nr:hypothetical protein [Caulobacteraceae bacterium]
MPAALSPRLPASGPCWAFGVISLDPALLDDTTERVNITSPRRALKRLDARARRRESRSGYIARLTLEEPRTPSPASLLDPPADAPAAVDEAGLLAASVARVEHRLRLLDELAEMAMRMAV